MGSSKIIYKYLITGLTFLLIFFFISVFVNYELNKQGFHQLPDQLPLKKIAAELNQLSSARRVEFLEDAFFLLDVNKDRELELYLINKDKKILFPSYKGEAGFLKVNLRQSISFLTFIFPSKDKYLVEPLAGSSHEYLVVKPKYNRYQKQLKRRRKTFMFIHGVLLLTMIIVFLVTIFFIFYSLKARVKHVDQVMSDISSGKLQSRLPIKHLDEIGFMMSRFNSMFDNVEGLVKSLRNAESVRKKLLSELAHDLRTPVASLKNFLEMLLEKRDRLTVDQQNDFFTMAISDYISHLVDDLLFLSLLEEGKYQQSEEYINIAKIIESELALLAGKFPNITQVKNIESTDLSIRASDYLIKRLVRNLFENSLSFAKSSISITLYEKRGGGIKLIVEDDGPGFTDSEIESYGKRKFSRQIEGPNNRISVGLGSVIIKSISERYGGTVTVSNIYDSKQNILGAQIVVTI